MTPRSPRCSIRSRLPGRGKTSAASSTSTSGSPPLNRSSCACIDHGRRAAVWRGCAGSLYWASESGANVDLRELRDAYDSSAPEPVTPDERQLLPGQITLIPLHWVASAGFMDERIGVPGTAGVSEAERAMDAAEAWWARRGELTW